MILLERTEKIRTESETEAKELMEKIRNDAASEGYIIKKCGYEHKEKKAKGEVIDAAEVVTVVKVYAGLWTL